MFQKKLGFSTGTLRNTHSYHEAVAIYRDIGCTALEISPSHIFSVKERPTGFVHVSTHDAPQKPYVPHDEQSHERLMRLTE